MPKPDDSGVNDSLKDVDSIRSVVETANAEDEKVKKDPVQENDDDTDEEELGNQDSEDDENSEDNPDDEENSDEESDDTNSERKFKNLAADTDKEYISNIEAAYEKSSKEAVRLASEVTTIASERDQANRRVEAIMAAAAKDPDLADRLNKVVSGEPGTPSSTPKPTDDPFTTDARARWREQSAKEVDEILQANPEITTDAQLGKDVKYWMEVFSDQEYQRTGKVISGGEAMTMAMHHLKIEDKRTKQNVASAAKGLAAPTRPQGARKSKPSKSNLTDAQYDFGEKMGVSKDTLEKYATK
jgi:hypothetical protein